MSTCGPRSSLLTLSLYSLVLGVILAGGCAPAVRDLNALASTTSEQGRVVTATIRKPDLTDAEMLTIVDWPQLRQVTVTECKQLTPQGFAGFSQLDELQQATLIHVHVGDQGLTHFARPQLTKLTLAHTQMTGAGLAALRSTPLTHLDLLCVDATAEGLASITKLNQLEQLDLELRGVTFGQLPSLRDLEKLRKLDLHSTKLGQRQLQPLAEHPGLESLTVAAEDANDDVFAVVSSIENLKSLTLFGAAITDEGLKQLRHARLETLSLGGCPKLTDAALANLSGLTNLRSLVLSDSGVTGKDLTPLAEHKSLHSVEFAPDGFRGGKAAIAKLKALLPTVQVQIVGG